MSGALRNHAPHAPGTRLQREGAVAAAAEQAPAHPRFELGAAVVGERRDVGAARPRALEKRRPVIAEGREGLVDDQRLLSDAAQAGAPPERAELSASRELHVALV